MTKQEALEFTYTFHTDPGHGWIEVPLENLAALGFKVSDFSTCSYRKGNLVFLEEDGDASKFARAFPLIDAIGRRKINLRYVHHESGWKGRNYNHLTRIKKVEL